MEVDSTEELSTQKNCIQRYNDNNKRSQIQEDDTQGLEEHGIKEKRRKQAQRMSSTDEGMDRSYANTLILLTNDHKILMFNQESACI